MKRQVYRLPQGAWFNEVEVEIALPEKWDVHFTDIPADQMPILSSTAIQQRLEDPIASPPLFQLAQGRKKAVIVFDDLSRPTDVAAVAPLVVEQLIRAGISESNISFVAALGCHGAHTLVDFTKKLGTTLVSRFPVYNHNPYENCSYVGDTNSGIPLFINNEVLSGDLKIGIGSIIPHPFNGFSGGGKIIFPGVADMESIYQNHSKVITDLKERKAGMLGNLGDIENNSILEDIADAVRLTGFNFKIDLLPNSRRQTVEMVAGHPLLSHSRGVEIARQLYAADYQGDADIVIANANAKASEALIALLLGAGSLKADGGDLVLIVDHPAGQVTHYLMGQHGNECGGRLWSGETIFPDNISRAILYTRNPGQRFGLFRHFLECLEWQDVVQLLQNKYGSEVKVVIFKDATMQYFRKA